MNLEKHRLTWPTYADHFKRMMKDLMLNNEFADVTLVTEDKRHIQANRSIISSCSPIFREILLKEKNLNQIIFLRGINFSEIESIMQFIYLGEATVNRERMKEFLAVAKSLEIKELCKAKEEITDEPESKNSLSYTEKVPDESKDLILLERIKKELSQSSLKTHKQSIHEDGPKYLYNKSENEASMQRQLTGHIETKHKGMKYECNKCDKAYSNRGALKTHKDSVHDGVKYTCDQCEYHASTQGGLNAHIKSKHEGVRYNCNKCDLHYSSKNTLTDHIQSKHEGLIYECDQCDLKFELRGSLYRHTWWHKNGKSICNLCDKELSDPNELKRHMKRKHDDGIKNMCHLCEYQSPFENQLIHHIQSKHEGVRYTCDLCDYKFTRQDNLTVHIKTKHGDKENV